MPKELLTLTKCGIFCEDGDFYIDPWRPVDKAVITHAHGDHARRGSKKYLASHESKLLLELRLGSDINLQTVSYGEKITFNNVTVSLHPAGHILGSSQVRVERNGEVWVVSGDYKIDEDCTCQKFELVKCHTFITESTFGLPVYKWLPQQQIFDDINQWWKKNKEEGIASIIFGYSLGKAQRILSGLDPSIGLIYTHGAVENLTEAYRNTGKTLPSTKYIGDIKDKNEFKGAMIIAPPSADNTPWLKRFGNGSRAFASGWMQVRGAKRWRAIDRGFVLSDHVDWNGIISTVKETGAENIWATHGYTLPLVKWLCDNGWNAKTLKTEFEGERDEAEE